MPDAHDLLVRAVGHAVVVVLDEEDDRQAEGAVAGEVVGPLVLGRPVEGLQDHAVRVGAIACEAADDGVALLVAARHRGARRDRHGAAADGVGTQVAGGEVADVHAATAAPAVALVLAEQLGDHLVQVLLERRVQECVAGRVTGRRRARAQLLVGHLAQGGVALRDRVAVPAVGAGHVVGDPQDGRRADGRRLLADGHVRRAAVVVAGEGLVAAAGAEADDHLLHLADRQHVVEQAEGARLVQRAYRDIGGQVTRVGEALDGPAGLLERLEVGPGVAAEDGLGGHGAKGSDYPVSLRRAGERRPRWSRGDG